jgi:hypothetical protein
MRRSFLAMQGSFELFNEPEVNALQKELTMPCSI